MAKSYPLEILTPTGVVFEGEAEELVAPGEAGEFGVLPEHIPFLTRLLPGTLIVRGGGRATFYAVYGGYCEVRRDGVTVLADAIDAVEDIDAADAQARQHEIIEKLRGLSPQNEEFAGLRRSLEVAEAQIAASSRRGA